MRVNEYELELITLGKDKPYWTEKPKTRHVLVVKNIKLGAMETFDIWGEELTALDAFELVLDDLQHAYDDIDELVNDWYLQGSEVLRVADNLRVLKRQMKRIAIDREKGEELLEKVRELIEAEYQLEGQ